MLCLKSGSPGINLWTCFAAKVRVGLAVDPSSQTLFLIYRLFYDWDGALMSKTG